MLRVSSSGVLVVAPFECAWIRSPDSIKSGCCISFDVKGSNDVTVIFKSGTTGRRWQHITHDSKAAGAVKANGGPPHPSAAHTEQNYTVILGSHRNTCVKVEKDGQLCERADNVPGTKLSGTDFLRFWVSYDAGRISVGTGAPGSGPACYHWQDPSPAAAIEHVGLSSWDRHVAYRDIQLLPRPVPPPPPQATAPSGSRRPQLDVPASDVPSLQDCCGSVLRGALSVDTVCTVLGIADVIRPTADSLRAAAISFLAEHLPKVLKRDPGGLQALSFDCMLDLLQHTSLGCDEDTVFAAVATWGKCCAEDDAALGSVNPSSSASGSAAVNGRAVSNVYAADEEAPAKALDQLLPLVRFPLMADDVLDEVARHPLAKHSGVLGELIQEAHKCHEAEEARQGLGRSGAPSADLQVPQAPLEVADTRHVRLRTSAAEAAAARRSQRRPAAGVCELMLVSDGDTNGVCHHLGTGGGAGAWVNPHAAGRVTVRASSPACRTTDPKALVGTNFARLNFAGPRLEVDGRRATWWSLDLGPRRALACNYYTLRADGSHNYPRSWSLQGSNDGATWTDLRRHEGDASIRLPGQFASWPVSGQAASRPFHCFRVLLSQGTGAATIAAQELALSSFELYGYLSTVPERQLSS